MHRPGDDAEDDGRYLSIDSNVHFASVQEKKRLWWRNATINCLYIASWFFFATILSVYNKWMFSEKYMNFPYPLLVTTLHVLVQFALAAFVRAVWPQWFRPARNPTLPDYGKKAAPTAIATGLDIGLSNLSLKTISLSFYTMVKSSSLIFVLLFAFSFRLEQFSLRLIGVIVLIFAGVLLMVATETHFVLPGFLMVLSASALGGLRWALTQVLLKNKKMGMDNPAATIFWLSPAMALTLAVVGAILEQWHIAAVGAFFSSPLQGFKTAFLLTAPGIIAFSMVLSEFYIIQRAGIVPMSIAGIAKEVTTITISAWIFGDRLTPLNVVGVAITVCGISLFTWHKYQKSLQTTIPLDAHGNPISPVGGADDQRQTYQVELDETEHLTSARPSEESLHGDVSRPLLFDAGTPVR
ncbi:triose phosphate transporter [Mycena floridula]|nr:triose phosphate transporter [Mycena floridula]